MSVKKGKKNGTNDDITSKFSDEVRKFKELSRIYIYEFQENVLPLCVHMYLACVCMYMRLCTCLYIYDCTYRGTPNTNTFVYIHMCIHMYIYVSYRVRRFSTC